MVIEEPVVAFLRAGEFAVNVGGVGNRAVSDEAVSVPFTAGEREFAREIEDEIARLARGHAATPSRRVA